MPIRAINDKQYKGVSELYRKSDGEVSGYYVTYRDIDGPIDRAIKQGVIAVLVKDGDNKRLESDKDFYCYFPRGWVGVEQYGLYEYLQTPGFKLVLFGRMIDQNTRDNIYNSAKNDTYIEG